jgi:GNAT superfamily N-acetyltransferase
MPDMLVKLYELPDPAPYVTSLRKEKVIIRQAMAYEKEQIVSWVKNTFKASPGWASECSIAFSHQPISCLLAMQNGAILGFACYNSTCRNFFGPMGVAARARKQGIGATLLISCLHRMAALGYAYAIVGDAGSPDFYAKAVQAVAIEGSKPGIYRDRIVDAR